MKLSERLKRIHGPRSDDFGDFDDWKYEVANGNTVLGFEEWFLHNIEADAGEGWLHGAHGSLLYDPLSGMVIDAPPSYEDIAMIDVAEWRRHYPNEDIPKSMDILDVGFLMHSGEYEQPARKDVKSDKR